MAHRGCKCLNIITVAIGISSIGARKEGYVLPLNFPGFPTGTVPGALHADHAHISLYIYISMLCTSIYLHMPTGLRLSFKVPSFSVFFALRGNITRHGFRLSFKVASFSIFFCPSSGNYTALLGQEGLREIIYT